ncbi:isochorismatase family protein [Alicyclobacillus fastidiosus]|uniref:Isochorismatase family protein n=1 Tax=Alicyclobacillus fastidiosus TaxID=392011 RepID=A0ABV5AAI6_9BACL|nr:isochorismatase family protein [Alicyclobacillus fastidiosus]WEH07583.1 isochorismatase family protein [Alicyclobacillus fastidiosus]
MRTDETAQELLLQRGFGGELELGKQPAVIVVDMIVGFTDPNYPLGSDLTPEITRINQLLDFAHAHDMPVYFTTIAYDDKSLADSGIWVNKMQGLETLIKGTRAVEVDARLHVEVGDALLVKKYASAFFGTDLVSRLIHNHVDTLLVTGCTTSGCVRATVVDALQYGFAPIVVEDAVGDRWSESHAISLFDMRQKYADVFTCETVLQKLDGYLV